jgi:alanine racemase
MPSMPSSQTLLALRANRVEMDYDALLRNYARVERLVGDDRAIIPSLKANAYGHDAVEVATRLASRGVHGFATGSIVDAVAIREAGVSVPIIIFGGHGVGDLSALREYHLIPTVYSDLSLASVLADPAGGDVYLKVDAGFGRLGVPLADTMETVAALERGRRVTLRGVYTHVPFSTPEGLEWARRRMDAFYDVTDKLTSALGDRLITQALDSASLLNGFDDRCNAVSPGHVLFGLTPGVAIEGRDYDFEPVLKTITTELVQVRTFNEGTSLGLNGQYSLPGGGNVGVIPFGRGDGYRPGIDGRARVIVDGALVPIIGASLEHTMLDLTDVRGASVGMPVTVLGRGGNHRISVEDLAEWQNVRPVDVILGFDRHLAVMTSGAAEMRSSTVATWRTNDK